MLRAEDQKHPVFQLAFDSHEQQAGHTNASLDDDTIELPEDELVEDRLPTSGSLYAVLTEMNRRLEAVAESGIQTGIPAHRDWFKKSRQEVHTFGLTALAPVLDSLSKGMSPQAIVRARYLTHLY